MTSPSHCKYRFKSWGWKKNIPEHVKKAIRVKVMQRAAQGKDTIVLYNGRRIPPGRLQRTKETTAAPSFSLSEMLSLANDKYDVIGGYIPFGNSL